MDMGHIDIQIIKDRLRPFVPDPDGLIRSLMSQTELTEKQFYAADEIDALLDVMVLQGGFVEFVAKILKSKMALNGEL